MSSSFEGLVGNVSPFSEEAESIRQKKKTISIIFSFLIMGSVLTMSIMLASHPPLLFWSSFIQFIIYGSITGIILALIVEKFVLFKIHSSKFGRKKPLILTMVTYLVIGTTIVTVFNFYGIKDIEVQDVLVTNKYFKIRKGKKRYYINFNVKIDTSKFYYLINEASKLSVGKRFYNYTYPGKTYYRLYINKGFFQVPQIDRYDYLNSGSQR